MGEKRRRSTTLPPRFCIEPRHKHSKSLRGAILTHFSTMKTRLLTHFRSSIQVFSHFPLSFHSRSSLRRPSPASRVPLWPLPSLLPPAGWGEAEEGREGDGGVGPVFECIIPRFYRLCLMLRRGKTGWWCQVTDGSLKLGVRWFCCCGSGIILESSSSLSSLVFSHRANIRDSVRDLSFSI